MHHSPTPPVASKHLRQASQPAHQTALYRPQSPHRHGSLSTHLCGSSGGARSAFNSASVKSSKPISAALASSSVVTKAGGAFSLVHSASSPGKRSSEMRRFSTKTWMARQRSASPALKAEATSAPMTALRWDSPRLEPHYADAGSEMVMAMEMRPF